MNDKVGSESVILTLEEKKKEALEFILKFANPKCGKCFGRGHKGFNTTTNTYLTCQCVFKKMKNLTVENGKVVELKNKVVQF